MYEFLQTYFYLYICYTLEHPTNLIHGNTTI